MIYSLSEENYIKAIYQLKSQNFKVSLIRLANKLQIRSVSVIGMIKKLIKKQWVLYEKKEGICLTKKGEEIALEIIRAHRLWEIFLSRKLCYNWDEVHAIAEHLEHVKAPNLLNRLDYYLKYPEYDPHGNPIPNSNSFINFSNIIPLSEVESKEFFQIVAIKNNSNDFLQCLQTLRIEVGINIKIIEKFFFDNSIMITIDKNRLLNISKKIAKNLLVQKI